jgi:hypothetical protein
MELTMKEITFSKERIREIRALRHPSKERLPVLVTQRRVRAPRWWEGHRIGYKVYPGGPGSIGRYAELLCARDGGRQRRNPYGEPGTLLRVRGTRLTMEIRSVELSGNLDDGANRAWVIELSRRALSRLVLA